MGQIKHQRCAYVDVSVRGATDKQTALYKHAKEATGLTMTIAPDCTQSDQGPPQPDPPINVPLPLVQPEHIVPSQQNLPPGTSSGSTTSGSSNDWLLEPAPGTNLHRTRETGWTISDWYSIVEEDGRTYQGYMPGGKSSSRLGT